MILLLGFFLRKLLHLKENIPKCKHAPDYIYDDVLLYFIISFQPKIEISFICNSARLASLIVEDRP